MVKIKRIFDPEKECKNFMQSMEEFLHKGQYPSLTILMDGMLNYLNQKEREIYLKNNPEGHANGNYRKSLVADFGELPLKISSSKGIRYP